jgi:pimeloyl-ACP methyl ester carboxylesterase
VEERRVETNGVVLSVTMAGPATGPLVILLHGFPEIAFAWREQLRALEEQGYWAWAPDQRGYNESEKPPGVASYRIDALVDDVVGLIVAAKRERAVLVAHDWGAAVAWRVAQEHPEMVARLVILDGPHPRAMRQALRSNLRQFFMSWYMFLFQLPGAERILLAGGAERLVRGLRRTSKPGTFDDDRIAVYRRAWEQPGAMRAMLDWYRAAFRVRARPARYRRISPPTLVLWGERDAFVGIDVARRSVDLCDDGQLQIIEGGTHWIHIEEPERVNQLMLSFLNATARQ